MRIPTPPSASSDSPSRVIVAAASDEAYALPLAVMLHSAAAHLGRGTQLEAHVVADELTSSTRARVEDSLHPGTSLRWVPRSALEFKGLPLWGRISLGTYHKLTLGSWLPPDVTQAIWIDCDTLVQHDLTDLWRQSMRDRTLLASPDPLVSRLGSTFGVAGWRELGLPPHAPYFNAGVMKVDLRRWRDTEVEPRALAYLRRFGPKVWFWDQEALNAVLAGHWGELDRLWNFPALGCGRTGADRPRIVHFSGNLKPWRLPGKGALFSAYQAAVDRTAWAGSRPPRAWRDRALAAYAQSRLRIAFLSLERLHLRWVRWSTRPPPPRLAP